MNEVVGAQVLLLTLKLFVLTVYFGLFLSIQPGSKRAGVGTEDKFGCKETKAATLDPLSCISKETKHQIIVHPDVCTHVVSREGIMCRFSRLSRSAQDVSHPAFPGAAGILSYELWQQG